MGQTLSTARPSLPIAACGRDSQRRTIDREIQERLRESPCRQTKNRKLLENAPATFEHEPPLWELRVGSFRVFYDVDEADQVVFIRAVREKPPHAETEDVL
jgi:mRNA-degrading endonuclease RelE of RelBE toxin-antitoxin system